MSTMAVIPEDYKFFDFLAPYVWPNLSVSQIKLLRDQVEHGIIQIESMLENALANASLGGYIRCAEYQRDFTDNSDGKKSISQFRNNNKAKNQWTNSFFVTGLKNKIGLLRVVCFSRQQDKFYFFALPPSAYQGKNEIEITADRSTGYKMDPIGIPKGKFTRWKLDTFEQLATITEYEAEQL